MLGSVAASKAAKAAALCICPVVGTAVVTTQVPAVRKAVHNATAPKAAKKPKRSRLALKKPVEAKAQALPVCADPIPVVLGNNPIKVSASDPESVTVPVDDTPAPPQRLASLNPAPPAFAFPALAAIPEPATWMQMLSGFAIVGATIRYSRKTRATPEGSRLA